MQLNVRSTPLRNAESHCSVVSCASVMTTDSIVAMFGAIMAAPLQTPLIRTDFPLSVTVAVACFGNVSVVIMARAAL